MAKAPLYQLYKDYPAGSPWSGRDYCYTVSLADARNMVTEKGYTLDRIAGVAYDTPATGLVEFKRYTYNDFHFYTTDSSAENLFGWTEMTSGPKIYLPDPNQPAPAGTTSLLRFLAVGQSGVAHFFTADRTENPPPSRWSQENLPARTGWTSAATEQKLTVTYDMSGTKEGITISGGRYANQHVTIGGAQVPLTVADAIVPFGVGNCVHFVKGDQNSWHFDSVSVSLMAGQGNIEPSDFSQLSDLTDHSLHLIDENDNSGAGSVGYNYCLTIADEVADRSIRDDPKIINRPGTI